MSTTLGNDVQVSILKHESHKLHHEFPVATGQTIVKGQFVKMNTAGELEVAAADEARANIIGIAVMDAASETVCTVMMTAQAILYCKSAAALNAGDVDIAGFDSTLGINTVKTTALAANIVGKALDVAAGADEIVRVAVFS